MNYIEQEYLNWKTYYSGSMSWVDYYYQFVANSIYRSSKQRDYKRNSEINRNSNPTLINKKSLKYKVEDIEENDIYINDDYFIIYDYPDTEKVYQQTINESTTNIYPYSYIEFTTDCVNAYVDFPDILYSEDRFIIDNNGNLIINYGTN